MRLALDTNILAYAEGVDDRPRQAKANALLHDRASDHLVIAAQVLAELFWVLMRKSRLSPAQAQERVEVWVRAYPVIDTDAAVLRSAMVLVGDHRIRFWDAIVLASAAEARCSILFSEDLQHGFTWRGVTVNNPFRTD